MSYTDAQIEAAARAAHEVNRTYCREVMNDDSHLPWKDTHGWARDSAIEGVRALVKRPETTAAERHHAWRFRVKEAEGWIYGKHKNGEIKIHPCMVPYDQLPSRQRTKDELFILVVRAVLGL